MLLKAQALEKRMNARLNESFDLTRQLAEAVDRGDQVAIQMELSMRREPLEELRLLRRSLEELRDALAPPDAARLAELLNGAAAEREAETALANQVALNDRLLTRLLQMDKAVNQKFGRERSLYHKNLDTGPLSG